MNTQRQTVTQIETTDDPHEALERLLSEVQASGNDTTRLPVPEKASLLRALSRALGLNPLSGGVMLLKTGGRETLYVTKVGTDQIAAREKLSRETVRGPEVIEIEKRKIVICAVRASHPDGRSEVSTKTLALSDPVNDLMRAETGAKRRATLSVCGLGLLAEDEIETVRDAQRVPLDDSERGVDLHAIERARESWERDDGREVTKPVPSLASLDNVTRPVTRPASQPPPPSALQRFHVALAKVTALAAIPALWRDLSQLLHNEGTADEAGRAVGGWMSAHRIPLNVAEENQLLSGNFSDDTIAAIDGVVELTTADAVVRWRLANDAAIKALDERDGSVVKMVAARRWADLAGVKTTTPGKAFGEAVRRATQPPPDDKPPSGTDGPRSARNASATGDATSAPVEGAAAPVGAPVDLATVVDAPGTRADGGDDLSSRDARVAHLGTKHHLRAIVASYLAHYGLPHYLDDCTQRMTEIVLDDGTMLHAMTARKRLVDERNAAMRRDPRAPARRTTSERVRKAG